MAAPLHPQMAQASVATALETGGILTGWNWDALVLLLLAVMALAYWRGVTRLWQRAGVGRGIARWQAAVFAAGLLAVLLALVSPLDTLSLHLFSAHMVQHLLLTLVAAPLLALGKPGVPWLWSLPPGYVNRLGGWRQRPVLRAASAWLTHPVSAWALHAGATWVWHTPGLYQAALEDSLIHAAEHASLLGTAILFWWVILNLGGRRHLGYGVGALMLIGTMFQGTALGALIAFSGTPWYPAYAQSGILWGLDPLLDQQMAGLIMWIPAGMVYAVVALTLLVLFLRALEQEMERRRRAVTTGEERAG